ncbi:MAG: putative peptidoglycan glycosyltransferase FtsW [Eubacteriales bacterium]
MDKKRQSDRRAVSTRPAQTRSTAPVRGTKAPVPDVRPEKSPAQPAKKRKTSDFIKSGDIIRVKGAVDRPMLIIIILLVCFGSVMVFSSSFAYSYQKYGDSYYFIKRQIIFGAIGLAAMTIAMFIDYRIIRRFTIPFFGVCMVLLILVPIIGLSQGAAVRWIDFGFIRFQPSELMKLGIVLMLALYISTYQDKITNYDNLKVASLYGFVYPMGIIGSVCALIMAENHFSGTIIMFLIGMVVLFAGGAIKRWFFIGGGAAAAVILIAIQFVDYAKERLDIWLHPENYSSIDEAWQTTQGLIAVGSGGLFGVGLGYSRQKHMFVSQPQNDFIFAIICEELGFFGALLVIALFTFFIWRGFVIALRAPDTFSSLVVIGIVSKVALQAMLNIAVVTNVIPNTGIALPFFSYGGTALTILLAEMGIVLSISRYSYQKK